MFSENWSTLTKEAYAIYMSFHKMAYYLKDAQVVIRCNNAPLHKFIYSVLKNEKVNNCSQEIPYTEFEQDKGNENELAYNLVSLKTRSI